MKISLGNLKNISEIYELSKKNGLLIEDYQSEEDFKSYYQWLYYHKNVNSFHIVGYQNQGYLIAHYGGVHFKYKYYDRYINVMLASNLVIETKSRNIHNFLSLQREFWSQLIIKKSDFALGLITRDGIFNLHRRAGWVESGMLRVYISPISFKRLFLSIIADKRILKRFFSIFDFFELRFSINFRSNSDSDIRVNQIHSFTSVHSEFLSKWLKEKKIAAVRDVNTLNNRFFSRPNTEYIVLEILYDNCFRGYICLRLMKIKQFNALVIVDYATLDSNPASLRRLIKESKKIARKMSLDCLVVAFNPENVSYWKTFFQLGFFTSFHSFIIANKFNKLLKPNQHNNCDWYITWFEHDYV